MESGEEALEDCRRLAKTILTASVARGAA